MLPLSNVIENSTTDTLVHVREVTARCRKTQECVRDSLCNYISNILNCI